MNKTLLGIGLFLLLGGCKAEPLTYDFLMQHPTVLQKEITRCQDNNSAECAVLNQAAHDFLQLINDRRDDPEEFGQQVMQVQTRLAELARQPGNKDEYQQQEKKLLTLYAVIAATSAE